VFRPKESLPSRPSAGSAVYYESPLSHAFGIILLAFHLVPAPFTLTPPNLFVTTSNRTFNRTSNRTRSRTAKRIPNRLNISISVLEPLLSCFSARPASLFHCFSPPGPQFLLCRLPRFRVPGFRFPRLRRSSILRSRLCCLGRAGLRVPTQATLVRCGLRPGNRHPRHRHNGEHCPSAAWYFHIYMDLSLFGPGNFRVSCYKNSNNFTRYNFTRYPVKSGFYLLLATHR
jgi:hypothetical protein